MLRIHYPFCGDALGIRNERNGTMLIVRTDAELDELIDALTRLRRDKMTGEYKTLQSNMREQYEAFCAMRNDINELIGGMASQESTLADGPEMDHECAAVVEAVKRYKDKMEAELIATIKENTEAAVWLGSVLVDTQIALREHGG